MSIPIGNLTLNLHMKYFIVYVTRNAKIWLKCLRAWCIESLQRLEVIYKGFPYSFLFTQIKFKYTNMCNISKCFSIHFLNIFGELHTFFIQERDSTKSCQFYFLSNSFVSYNVIYFFLMLCNIQNDFLGNLTHNFSNGICHLLILIWTPEKWKQHQLINSMNKNTLILQEFIKTQWMKVNGVSRIEIGINMGKKKSYWIHSKLSTTSNISSHSLLEYRYWYIKPVLYSHCVFCPFVRFHCPSSVFYSKKEKKINV